MDAHSTGTVQTSSKRLKAVAAIGGLLIVAGIVTMAIGAALRIVHLFRTGVFIVSAGTIMAATALLLRWVHRE